MPPSDDYLAGYRAGHRNGWDACFFKALSTLDNQRAALEGTIDNKQAGSPSVLSTNWGEARALEHHRDLLRHALTPYRRPAL